MVKKDRRQHKDASPTERALSEIRNRGWYAVSCEAWMPAGGRCCLCRTASFWRRHDFGGFADLIALPSLLAVQVTSAANHAARVHKITHTRTEAAWWWLAAGGAIEVWSWREAAKPVGGKPWVFRATAVEVPDLLAAGFEPPETQKGFAV